MKEKLMKILKMSILAISLFLILNLPGVFYTIHLKKELKNRTTTILGLKDKNHQLEELKFSNTKELKGKAIIISKLKEEKHELVKLKISNSRELEGKAKIISKLKKQNNDYIKETESKAQKLKKSNEILAKKTTKILELEEENQYLEKENIEYILELESKNKIVLKLQEEIKNLKEPLRIAPERVELIELPPQGIPEILWDTTKEGFKQR